MKGGKFSIAAAVCAAAVCLFTADAARAVIVPFTETFDSSSGWTSDGNAFYGTFYSFAGASEGDSPILFRATGSNSPSGDAFAGDWITADVATFSFDVYTTADTPLTFFARFATAANFPGVVIEDTTEVAAGTWTTITMDIDPSNPNLTVEGPPSFYDAAFGNIGNVQIGVVVDADVIGDTVVFGIDNVSLTAAPEPASMAALGLGVLAMARRRRRAA
ncbi:PEP-CTERM sorting domain-containing protein [Planctomycetales bacterium ZRK34]|nr:PEP-CTERM sorting domain-containing protein [Planctomycetales bacterium ZRK34]